MGTMSKEAHDYLAAIDPCHWTRSKFSEKFKCDMLLNNLCECFNSFILDARTKGFITMNEVIRTLLMKRIQKKRMLMMRRKEEFCPKIIKKLEKARQISWYYRSDWSGGDKYQVFGADGQYVVDKREHTCTCRRWQLTGIPCHHAISAMNVNNESPESYLHRCYRVETYLRIYSHFLNPTNGKQLWEKSNMPPIIPPEPVNLKRGKKTLLRRREPDEIQRGSQGPRGGVDPSQPARISRAGGSMTCTVCGGKGHNRRSCTTTSGSRGQGRVCAPQAHVAPQPAQQESVQAQQPPTQESVPAQDPPTQESVQAQDPPTQASMTVQAQDPTTQASMTVQDPPNEHLHEVITQEPLSQVKIS